MSRACWVESAQPIMMCCVVSISYSAIRSPLSWTRFGSARANEIRRAWICPSPLAPLWPTQLYRPPENSSITVARPRFWRRQSFRTRFPLFGGTTAQIKRFERLAVGDFTLIELAKAQLGNGPGVRRPHLGRKLPTRCRHELAVDRQPGTRNGLSRTQCGKPRLGGRNRRRFIHSPGAAGCMVRRDVHVAAEGVGNHMDAFDSLRAVGRNGLES